MNRFFVLLISSLGMLLLLAAGTMPAAAQETYTATPVADAWVASNSPDTTYNTTSLAVYKSGSLEYYSLMAFAERPRAISATLNLYSVFDRPTIVYLQDAGYFDELNVSYNNSPALGFVFSTSESIGAGIGYTKIDVTEWWNRGGDSFAIFSESNPPAFGVPYFGSSERANPSFVEYALPTPEPTAVPPPAEPQLIHCYDFDIDSNDFFGGVDVVAATASFLDGGMTLPTGTATATYADLDEFTISLWYTAEEDQNMTFRDAGELWAAGMGYSTAGVNSDETESVIVLIGFDTPTTAGLHHYAIVADGDDLILYRDGVQVATTTQYTTNQLSSIIASWQGRLDAMSIYSGVESPAALYADGLQDCADQIDPTAVVISQQLISLPSGGLARVDMTATAGELFVSGVLIMLVFIGIWQAVERLANFNSKR